MCGKHFWENMLVITALCSFLPLTLNFSLLDFFFFYGTKQPFHPSLHPFFNITQVIEDMLEQKPSFVRRFRLAFKEKWRPAPHNDSIWVTRRSLIFPGRSHLTWLPGGIGDLRVSCNMQTDASAVVCAGRKEGKGWALVLCRWQYWCVGADGVLQLFLCQSIKALHHTVCRQTSLRVMIPALCYSRTQELHALKQQAQMSVTHSKKLVNIIAVCQCQQIYTYVYILLYCYICTNIIIIHWINVCSAHVINNVHFNKKIPAPAGDAVLPDIAIKTNKTD